MGKIVVIEGTDGSGKQTQANLVYEELVKRGVAVKKHSFPSYESPSSGPLKMYLGGELSKCADEIDAYQASSLFAVDRLCTMLQYKVLLEQGCVLILDRYVQSNMIHQAGKIANLKERDGFLEWLNEFEFEILKLPKADKVIFLDVPVETSKRLANERTSLKCGEKKDIHESDMHHLENAYNAGKYVAKKFNWTIISCTENGKLKSIEEIHKLIMKEIKKEGLI